MRQYWLRVLAAWILVRMANAMMRDAERLLQRTADYKPHLEVVDTTATDTPEAA